MSPHQKAKAWRIARRFTIPQLSELTGWSPESIVHFERGTVPGLRGTGRRPVNPHAFMRYRMSCAGLEARFHVGGDFDWQEGWGR